jgi:flavin-dependent dehydrogenase
MYDVIIVGARVAGASTALLLARRGLRVLAVDRATFPSDTLSTHQVQVPGAARLARWGLLDRLVAAGTPTTRRVRLDQNGIVLDGTFPAVDGVDALVSPRRTVLDALLVDAAREAGAEVRENVVVEELVDGGVRCREKGGAPVVERAPLIVGADGKHSLVARSVGAREYRRQAPRSVAFYAYWQGVPLECGEMYGRPGRIVGAWPTNDGLVITYLAWPVAEFDAIRRDVEGAALRSLDATGLGERIRAGRRVERFRGSPELPAFFRTPYGPGWALVGDAGLTLDPITGQGIGHALRDAELLADAVAGGGSLAGYHRARDRATLPMARMTARLARLAPPPPGERLVFEALARDPGRFFGVLSGVVSPDAVFSPRALVRLLGVRTILSYPVARLRAGSGGGALRDGQPG